MANPADPVGRAPRRSSGAGWWVAAAVAAIAAVGLFFILQSDERADSLQAARAPRTAEARLDGVIAAEPAASRADEAARPPTDSSARATRRAAEAAQRAADAAARSVDDAAQNAAATAPAPQQP